MDIQKIKQNNDIAKVIGRYVTLTYKGNKATGLCPFHDDHHPSLQVDLKNQYFKCYACGEGGDVIAFVMNIEKCGFKEAVEKLSPESAPQPPKGGANNTPLALNSGSVPKTPPLGGRGVKQELVPDHTSFLKTLIPYWPGHAELSKAYLEFEVGTAHHLVPYDWKPLAGRIIFPIRDEEGVLKGFSGRAPLNPPEGGKPDLPPSGGLRGAGGGWAKYLNTPSAHGFERNAILYGLHRAKEVILSSGTICITEGFKDVIAMHAAGFTYTVGLCGTAFSGRQIELIRSYADRVILLMDGDEPGRIAARRLAVVLGELGMDVVTVQLPEGHDPDSLFRCLGKEEFAAWLLPRAFPPHPTECRLIYACLAWPEAYTFQWGKKVTYLELLPDLLASEQLEFEYPEANLLFQRRVAGWGMGRLYRDLPDMWKQQVGELDMSVRMIRQLVAGACDDPETVSNRLIDFLFYTYCDVRLTRHVRDTIRSLHRETSPCTRRQLFRSLLYRKDQQAHIANLLEYPAALWQGR